MKSYGCVHAWVMGGGAHQYVIFGRRGVDPSVTLASPLLSPLPISTAGHCDNHLSYTMEPENKLILNLKSEIC